MRLRSSLCVLVMGSVGFGTVASVGCRTSEAAGQTSGGTPARNATFQTRDVRPCPSVRHRPSSAEAAALVQCTQDSVARDHIMLMQDVSVSVGAATQERPYDDQNDIDVRAVVYPISGSLVMHNCSIVDNVMNNGGKNCDVTESKNMTGLCYSNRAGDYRCRLGGGEGGFHKYSQPGPMGY